MRTTQLTAAPLGCPTSTSKVAQTTGTNVPTWVQYSWEKYSQGEGDAHLYGACPALLILVRANALRASAREQFPSIALCRNSTVSCSHLYVVSLQPPPPPRPTERNQSGRGYCSSAKLCSVLRLVTRHKHVGYPSPLAARELRVCWGTLHARNACKQGIVGKSHTSSQACVWHYAFSSSSNTCSRTV